MLDRRQAAAIALMAIGLLFLTVVPDLTAEWASADLRLAMGATGGLTVFGAGSWGYYDVDRRGLMDERYVKIFLRAAFFAWWGSFWLLLTLDSVMDDVSLGLSADSALVWVSAASLGLFLVGIFVFERLM